ncbi:anthranilate phosphoribosyltransferase [uncultured Helicobacter sp.]|uniref:anthranilate phosphoribosyltransferase n=1 Tax=uncultured Helicobacter sp. TaxID=175537 RepID=UPI0025973EA9|nr:anthranilate phosphoribosyltransferase [uncultured Helicobacter sp.]
MQNKLNEAKTKDMAIKKAIIELTQKHNLSQDMAFAVMNEIMQGLASPVQISAYLTALSMKGENIDEITASTFSMRAHCVRLLHDMDALEIVGTGGDHSNSFNISTTAALIVSSAGVKVAKHGNRAASSKCGAADVLEALGVNITIPPEKSKELLESINICFLFAQNYHIAMKYVAPIRKELGIRTIFNILGPLSNPAGANMELLGVYDESLVEPMAKVMQNLGVKRGMVVYGMDKIDEISLSSETKIAEINKNELKFYTFHPRDAGFSLCDKSDLVGGDATQNAKIIREILEGKEKGAKRDVATLNAGAALYIAGMAKSIESGVRMAEKQIDNKLALAQLERFIKESNK